MSKTKVIAFLNKHKNTLYTNINTRGKNNIKSLCRLRLLLITRVTVTVNTAKTTEQDYQTLYLIVTPEVYHIIYYIIHLVINHPTHLYI